jgi:hypothetical protein
MVADQTSTQNGRSVNDHFAGLRPEGPTPIGHRLDIILGDYFRGLDAAKRREDAGDYFARRHVKPVNVIVITDGTPSEFVQRPLADFPDIFAQRMIQRV